jgi:hypothetical protein
MGGEEGRVACPCCSPGGHKGHLEGCALMKQRKGTLAVHHTDDFGGSQL